MHSLSQKHCGALNIIIISGIVYHDDTTVIISKHSMQFNVGFVNGNGVL